MSTRSTSLKFGAVGRCGCGEIGPRRHRIGGEPICRRCLPMRTGPVMMTGDKVEGVLSPSQRAARKRMLAR